MGQRGPCKSRGLFFFPMQEETTITNWEQDFFLHHRLVSEVKKSRLCY